MNLKQLIAFVKDKAIVQMVLPDDVWLAIREELLDADPHHDPAPFRDKHVAGPPYLSLFGTLVLPESVIQRQEDELRAVMHEIPPEIERQNAT